MDNESSSPSSSGPDDEADRIIDAFLALTAERGPADVSLAAVAERAGLPLARLHRRFPSQGALLAGFADRLDRAVLAGDPPSAAEPVRDRLFDLSMRRFDALQAKREAVRAILRQSRGDPWLALAGGGRLLRSAALMLEAAGIGSTGLKGRARSKAFAALHLAVLRVWLEDDSPDMARTMAALDKALGRAEGLAALLRRGRCRSGQARTDATPPADEQLAGSDMT